MIPKVNNLQYVVFRIIRLCDNGGKVKTVVKGVCLSSS